ncbi:MAG TPA: hypothetical protein ENN21_01200 [Spirochaetes bacterium]|nr:hypothetical protein [Spirochaetota bacterium]
MKKNAVSFLPAVVLVLSAAVAPLSAHSEMPVPLEQAVKSAGCVAVAVIKDIRITRNRCETATEIRVKLLEFIRGTCPVTDVSFMYTVHHWKRARFPWQEECPSVHYTAPPRLADPRKGQRVIVTVGYFKDWKNYYATSMSDIARRREIEKMK